MDKSKIKLFYGIKRYFQLLKIYARMDLASLMRDGKFMAIVIIADIVSNISSISGIFLLAWKFPLSGMPMYIRYPLLTIIPAGLTAWFPTMILLRKTAALECIYPAIYALLISLTATYFFRKGFRYYVKKGIGNFFRQERKTVSALDNVSFQIRYGEFVAYAGPNGAGKSTTMKLLSGMLQSTEGTISVLGMSPEKDRIALMKKLGVLFGNRTELWWDHPVMQSFEWKKVVWDIPDTVYKRNLDMVTELLDIGEIRNTFARELSLG